MKSPITVRDLLMLELERPMLFSNHPIQRFGCSFRRGFVIILGHSFITRPTS